MSLSPVKRDSIVFNYGNTSLATSAANLVKNTALGPYKVVMSVWTMINVIRNPTMPITEQAPTLQRKIERLAYYVGLNQTCDYVRELYIPDTPFIPSFPYIKMPVNTSHLVYDPSLCAVTFAPHWQGEYYKGSSAYDIFFNVLQKVFPEESFTENDAIFLCQPHQSIILRGLFTDALKIKSIDTILPQQVQAFIDRWKGYAKENRCIHLVEESNRFSTGVLTRLVLGESKASDEICDAIHYMTMYMFRSLTFQAHSEEAAEFEKHCKIFRQTIYDVIASSVNIPLFNSDIELTKGAKIANLFAAFFAGQETTSFALTMIIASAALDPVKAQVLRESVQGNSQDLLKNKVLMQFVADCLLKVPPVNGVAKRLTENTTLTFKTEDGRTLSKKMQHGEKPTAIIDGAWDRIPKNVKEWNQQIESGNIFGHGKNRCVGQVLALKELAELTKAVLNTFDLSTNETEFTYTSGFTKIADTFKLQVSIRT